MKILLVEDNDAIVMGLSYLLQEEGFDVCVAATYEKALQLWKERSGEEYDLILLDISLPDGDGYELCRTFRRETDIPIVFLTAREEENDLVKGFSLGADDYVCKPFRNRELISRIQNALRRHGKTGAKIRCGELVLDTREGTVLRQGIPLSLTKLEYRILSAMMSYPEKLFTREEILENVWDSTGNFVNDNTLSVTMKRLREKVGDPDGNFIKTVRGMGYRIEKE